MSGTTLLPAILETNTTVFLAVSKHESGLLTQARKLFDGGFFDHALLDIWNAGISNLRRRVEAYGTDLFVSVVKEEPGRKKYDKAGDTLSERWSGVDDLVLIGGATRLGLLNKKAGKALEMINWMRNHASPAHDSDDKVEQEDVVGLAMILTKNLFSAEMPDPGHSVSSLFDPVKAKELKGSKLALLQDQIKQLKTADIRVAFGFLLDLLCKGDSPATDNAKELLPTAWDKASDDVRKTAGIRYHSFILDPSADNSSDNGGAVRLLDFLTAVKGVPYIPDGARSRLYRRAAKLLGDAKDTAFGWAAEEKAARTLAQFGPAVPSVAFEEVYQEILASYCGNYWGRSKAHKELDVFIDSLNTTQIRRVALMFSDNDRVQEELSQQKPTKHAVDLLKGLKSKLTISSHRDEIDEAIAHVQGL